MHKILEFPDRESAAQHAASRLASALREQLAERETACMVVSGGQSPTLTLQGLAAEDLPWQRVQVTLSDERCVSACHPQSNQRMVRHTLIDPSGARFLEPSEDTLAGLSLPLACVLLGMGEDGHFASLFPDFSGLQDALDVDSPQRCVKVASNTGRLPRISTTLSFLVNTGLIVLLIFGEIKKALLHSCAGLPVESLLRQNRAAVEVVWAP